MESDPTRHFVGSWVEDLLNMQSALIYLRLSNGTQVGWAQEGGKFCPWGIHED